MCVECTGDPRRWLGMWRSLLACLAVMAAAVSHARAAPGGGDATATAAPPARLTVGEVAAHMRALAIKKRDALAGGTPAPASAAAAEDGSDIPASDPCKRPDAA